MIISVMLRLVGSKEVGYRVKWNFMPEAMSYSYLKEKRTKELRGYQELSGEEGEGLEGISELQWQELKGTMET